MTSEEEPERISLKWGSLKSWHTKSEAAQAALKRYFDSGPVMMSAMAQRDTPEQKEALYALIDAIDGEIWLDWDGKQVSKEEAKEYIRNYGAK